MRFFKTPNDDGRPDLPWHSVDDLHRALGLNRSARKFFLHKLRNDWEWDVARTIATDSGLIIIAPHFVAQGSISAMVETGMASPKAATDYTVAGTEALQNLVGHLQFPSKPWLQFMAAAMKRHEAAP